MELHHKRCIPCEGNVPPLAKEEAERYLAELSGWALSEDGKKISKTFTFANFEETMGFVDKIAAVAEEEGHHPDMHVSYNTLTVELTTHAIGGLSENDFICAAKIERL